MPNRPQPGQRRGGGGLDLGALLAAIYGGVGGVEANPGFAEQGPTPSGLTIGEQSGPVKGRTFFDKGEASRLNTDYRLNNLSADKDAARKLQLNKDLLPIQLQQKQGESDIDVAAKTKLSETEHGLRTKEEEAKYQLQKLLSDHTTGNQVLGSNNIIPNANSRLDYQDRVNPEQLKALLSGLQARMSSNNAAMADTERDQLVKSGTFPDMLATAQTGAKNTRTITEGQNPQDLLSFQRMQREQQLQQAELDMTRGRFMPGNAPIVDITKQPATPAYTPPLDPAQQMMQDRLKGLQTRPGQPAAQSQQSTQPTGEMVTVVIDGMTVRIPKEYAARLSGAQ